MSRPLAHQIVARARQIIADPKHWTQGAYAVFKNGGMAEPHYRRAYSFCAVGALSRAAHELTYQSSPQTDLLADKAHRELRRFARLRSMGLEALNDGPNGHAEVLQLFDRFLKAH